MPFFLTRKPLSSLSKVSNEKGHREIHPSSGKPNMPHKGIDLVPVDGNLDVFAAHDGEVIFSGQQTGVDKEGNPILDPKTGKPKLVGYGNYIVVLAPDGRRTIYAHLATILVEAKQKIGPNQGLGEVTKIGIAGNTGGSTGVHLHFEIREADRSIANPRTYLAEAFPDEFDKTVNAGIELSEELEGDRRDNNLIGNKYQNILKGLAGFDTYFFPTLSGQDVVIDEDQDGKIVIGKTTLEGEAKPKTDAAGNIIPNVWFSSLGFDLAKSGQDLVIKKSGSSASSSAASVTIKNYPFDKERVFGIALGKTKDPSLGYDNNSKGISPIWSSYIYPIDTANGGFFGMGYDMFYITGNGYRNYHLAKYDNLGNQISATALDAELPVVQILRPFSFTDSVQNKKYVLVPFYCSTNNDIANWAEKVGIISVDSLGNIVGSKIIAQGSRASGNSARFDDRSGIGVDGNNVYFRYSGSPFLHIDPQSLEVLDRNSGAFISSNQYVESIGNTVAITLRDGSQVSLYAGNQLTMRFPKLRDLRADEITPTYDLATGFSSTNPNLKQYIGIAQADSETLLQILPNPNSYSFLIGFNDNPQAKLSLPYDISEAQIYLIPSGQYLVEDYFAGKFVPPASRRLDASFNQTDDYGGYDDDTPTEVPDNSSMNDSGQSTIMIFPNGQTIILAGMNATAIQLQLFCQK